MFLDGETKMLLCNGSARCKSSGCHRMETFLRKGEGARGEPEKIN